MARVELDRVCKSFGSVNVINDVSFAVEDGSFVALLGPSGCGKSTLLRLIAGLEEASAGDVIIGGRKVNDEEPADRGIAMVFQSYALYPHMTVAQNIGFSLEVARKPKTEIEAKVKAAVGMLRLEDLLRRKPSQLSGGQRQRVAIGRALVRDPTVFLFDEPLSNLDALLRVQMRLELAKLHRNLRTTMIYVTHDQTEAMTLASKIIVLDHGRIAQIGSPLELYHKPANRFVATFVGMPAINMLPASALRNGTRGVAEIGIRPEHVSLLPPKSTSADLSGVVQLVERLGNATVAHVETPPGTITAMVGPDANINPGETLAIRFDRRHIVTFSKEGVAMSHGTSRG